MLNSNNSGTFSMRKIPFVQKNEQPENVDEVNLDKVKILELSNIIDKWEQEVLFSKDGFFSIQGKEVKDKLKYFEIELDKFISEKISEMKFENEQSKEIALKIKNEKTNALKKEMKSYAQDQLKNWELDVYENSLLSSINKAVLYKSNPLIISSSLKNGLNVLQIMAEKENWNKQTLNHKVLEFKSKFYSSLINSFIRDKDINAYKYFDKFKEYLLIEEKDKIEKVMNEFKVNVIAYNWAKEVYSYNLSDKEQTKKIKEINDKEIESQVQVLLSDFKLSDEKFKAESEKEKNKENWQEILNILEEDKDKAYLYIDYSLKKENINSKKQYIKQIKDKGYISTDKKKFIDIISEFLENFDEFKTKDITDYQSCLSKEDYSFFLKLQSLSDYEYEKINADCKFLNEKIKEKELKNHEDKYALIKLLFSSKDEYKNINKKEADLKARNEIIELVLARVKCCCSKEGK